VPPPPHPEQLFEQADTLATRPEARQTDLRRAISAAYYGLFHFALTAAADMVVGADKRETSRYSLVYRSVDHSRLRTLSTQLSTTKPGVPLVPSAGFGKIADFARVAGNLHELRNLADYEPAHDFTAEEAELAISDARQAVKWFQESTAEQQEAFLALLLFKSRN
jgi:uncharacterized protein (UPF0332 family)